MAVHAATSAFLIHQISQAIMKAAGWNGDDLYSFVHLIQNHVALLNLIAMVVQDFHEKVENPPSNLANGAIYILEPSVLEWMIGLGKNQVDLSTEVIPNFLGKMFTYQKTQYHRDIGTIKSWIQANRDFPIMAANEQNEKAWLAILKKEDGQLARVISKLGTF